MYALLVISVYKNEYKTFRGNSGAIESPNAENSAKSESNFSKTFINWNFLTHDSFLAVSEV